MKIRTVIIGMFFLILVWSCKKNPENFRIYSFEKSELIEKLRDYEKLVILKHGYKSRWESQKLIELGRNLQIALSRFAGKIPKDPSAKIIDELQQIAEHDLLLKWDEQEQKNTRALLILAISKIENRFIDKGYKDFEKTQYGVFLKYFLGYLNGSSKFTFKQIIQLAETLQAY